MLYETVSEIRPKRLTIVGSSSPGDSAVSTFADEVRLGLTARPKTLPWPYFYDEAGSRLFERICSLPEYYLTRTEDAILRAHAREMVDMGVREPSLIELGSGSAAKTRRLIAAAIGRYGQLHYIPIDVSSTALVESSEALVRQFAALRVTGYVGDYRTELPGIAERVRSPRLWIYLGSSLGNYLPEEAVALLARLSKTMRRFDRLLLGTDLAKDAKTLEAAYDDAQGVSARFNLNLLARINRELDGDFDLAQFAHRAVYRPEAGRVEMHLVSLADQVVAIPGAALTVSFAEGETIHTENSHKYTEEGLRVLAESSGFEEETAWTDRRGFFRVQRWKRRA